jgi:hypothetical protein
MAKMQSAKPARKAWLATLVAAAVTLVCGLIEWAAKTQIPTAIVVAITTLATGISSYFVPPAEADQVVP